MRRLGAAILVVLGLVIGSAASAAPAKTVTVEYEEGHGVRVEHNLTMVLLADDISVPKTTVPANARTVSVRIVDESGLATDGHLHVDKNGDGKEERSVDFCSETADPIPVKPGAVLEVWLFSGSCNGAPSMATSGTIEFTFGG